MAAKSELSKRIMPTVESRLENVMPTAPLSVVLAPDFKPYRHNRAGVLCGDGKR